MLEDYNIEIEGKDAVIVGRSNIVGKPMMQCLLNKNATVTICHSRTVKLERVTSRADILVVAIGKEKFIKKDMVKDIEKDTSGDYKRLLVALCSH